MPDDNQTHARHLWKSRGILSSGFFLGSFGANVVVFPVTALLLYYLTDTVGMSVAIATAVMTIPKVWDMFVDPAIGSWSDQYARRVGNRAGVFAFTAIAMPAAALALFVLPDMPNLAFAVLATAILILKSVLYTIFLVGHVAAADDIGASGIMPRNTMLAVRIAGQAAGGLAAGAIAPLLLEMQLGSVGGFALMSALFLLIGVLGIGVCAASLRSIPTAAADEVVDGKSTAISLRTAMRAAIKLPVALSLIVGNFAVTMAGTFINAFLPYVNKYVAQAPDSALSPMFTALMGTMLLGSAVSAWLSQRIGNTGTFYLATACHLVSAISFYFISTNPLALAAALAIWGLGMGLYIVSLQSSLLDEAKSPTMGTSAVGLMLGLLFAGGKIGDTLGGLMTGVVLTFAGIDGGTMTDTGKLWMRAGLGLMPAALVIVGFAVVFLTARRHSLERPL